jgi:membrane protein implicated in regulation of membrane protease activity
MVWWIWVLIAFGILGLEMTAATLHVGFFAVGALVVALLVALGMDMPLWAQLVIFTIVSLVAFFFLRPVLVKKLKLDQKKVVDSLVGEQALALEDIGVGGNGRAEMRGTTWSARNIGETALIRGQRCVVAEVDGLVIHLRAS